MWTQSQSPFLKGEKWILRWGGAIWNTLRGSGIEKSGEETKILKSGGKLGQSVGVLKRGEMKPSTNYGDL